MADQQLINQFLNYVASESGISHLEKNANAKYELVFQPKEVIPKYIEELTNLKKAIALKGDEYFKALTEQSKSDPRLAALDLKTKLHFIGERLLPEMKASVDLLNAKYPHLLGFINGSSARKIAKHVAKSDEVDLDGFDEPVKRRKRKASKKSKK